MNINLQVQTEYYLKALGKTLGKVQSVAAETVNETADEMKQTYNTLLKRKTTVRTKFTTNATKVYKSNPVRRNGTPRPLTGINSKVVIRKMKGNKEHYLAKLEHGEKKTGSPLTLGKVAVPLNQARTSKSYSKSIARANRLEVAAPQKLRVNGRKIGVKGDGYKNTRKRWASLYAASKSGKVTGDINKPFFMIDNKNQAGIFKMQRKKIRKIRKLEKSTTRQKPEPLFKTSFKSVNSRDMQKLFVDKAKKLV